MLSTQILDVPMTDTRGGVSAVAETLQGTHFILCLLTLIL